MHIKKKKGFRATRIMTNYYSTPGPPRKLLQKFFSLFLPGSHTLTSTNQKGPESPGHVTESARGPSTLGTAAWNRSHCALQAKEHQAVTGLCQETSRGFLPATRAWENSWPWFTSKAKDLVVGPLAALKVIKFTSGVCRRLLIQNPRGKSQHHSLC